MLLIWCNTSEWGGVNVLVMRFAEYLRGRQVEFVIADAPGSRLRQDIPWATFVSIEDARTLDGKIDRILFPTVAMLRDMAFPWDCFQNARILGWGVQPNTPFISFVPLGRLLLESLGYRTVRPLLTLFGGHRHLVTRLFQRLADGSSLALMDEANRRALDFFYPDASAGNARLIPIPAPLSPDISARPPKSPLTFSYFGRIDPMKWPALGPFITDQLAALARTRRVKLLSVCEGVDVPRLDDTCRTAGIELERHGFMPNAEARRFIRERAHIGIAMGTSALDLAAAGLPCLVIDPSAQKHFKPQQRFRFIHEAEGFTLGEYRDFPRYRPGLHSLPEAVALAESQDLSGASRNYVATHHDPDRCFSLLQEALSSCRTTVGDVAPLALAIERSIVGKNRLYGWIRQLTRG